MKFWYLEPTDAPDNPHSKYDCMSFLIVRAETEQKARELAAPHHGDEGAECWLNPAWSTCTEYSFPLMADDEELVWSEFYPG